MKTPYLAVEGISLSLKGDSILEDVSMHAESGEVVGISGRNGSGKSMLFKCIVGLLVPQRGEITVDGFRVVSERRFPPELGALIEKPGFIGSMSGFDNLELLASIQSKTSKRDIREALHAVGLDGAADTRVRKYSLGMKQRLGIAQAIMENPKLLILDEPTSGLDAAGVEMLHGLVLELKARGTTILLASHLADDIRTLSDRVLHMQAGRLVTAGAQAA